MRVSLGHVLDAIFSPNTPPFALVNRPHSAASDQVELLIGKVETIPALAQLAVPGPSQTTAERHDLLVLLPYRQLLERGYAAHDDCTPLQVMRIASQEQIPVDAFLGRLPESKVELNEGDFDLDDDDYARLVQRVIADEIGTGAGSNFVLKRTYSGDITDFGLPVALAIYGRLLRQELGAYWTFLVHTGDRTLIGASPERHISLDAGTVTMNPISGTYRYPPSGPDVDGLLAFLGDRKEADELFMVVDEELKMMGAMCDNGAKLIGPQLKEMARLAHTEYFLVGQTTWAIPEILRHTMFAPTVTGSPIESATKVIARHEPRGRGYYAGAIALISSERGHSKLDSAIMIRCMDVDAKGHAEIGVGATLVRHSNGMAEAAETRAKAAGLLMALGQAAPVDPARTMRKLGQEPRVLAALQTRNEGLASFWLQSGPSAPPETELTGARVLMVDAEDTFTSMLATQIRSLGATVHIRRFDEQPALAGHDLVVVGPGPGDPRDLADPKVAMLRCLTQHLLEDGIPFLSVCLGHQVLCRLLGLQIRRRPTPAQGEQRRIRLFADSQLAGFYNTFAATSESDSRATPYGVVDVCRDSTTGEVFALQGPGFRSIQFHAESILTENGPAILRQMLGGLSTDGRR
jgi:phenazine biosynthesis protein phzE